MKIRMLTSICGPGVDLSPRAETESFSDAEALRLMMSDQAEPADEVAEAALAEAREQAETSAEEPEQAEKPEIPASDALDHDGDGKKGGSRKGAASTRAKGARKRG